MKRHVCARLAVAVFIIFSALPAGSLAEPGERFLVLGFSTKQLNDLQDRLLRESIMRRLGTRGFRIVPVMEVESLLQGERRMRVRSLTRAEVRGLCRDLGAGRACFGSIEPEEGARDLPFVSGRRYRCSLSLYRRDRDGFKDIDIPFTGRENLFDLYEELSESIAARIGEAL